MPTSVLVQPTAANGRSGDHTAPLQGAVSQRIAALVAQGKDDNLYLPLWVVVSPPLEGDLGPNL